MKPSNFLSTSIENFKTILASQIKIKNNKLWLKKQKKTKTLHIPGKSDDMLDIGVWWNGTE